MGELVEIDVDTLIGAMAAAIAIFVIITIYVLIHQKRKVPEIVRSFVATGILFAVLGLLPETYSIDRNLDLALFVGKSYVNLVLPLTIILSIVFTIEEKGLSSRTMVLASGVALACASVLTFVPLFLLGPDVGIPVIRSFHGVFHLIGGGVGIGIIRSRHNKVIGKVSADIRRRYLLIISFLTVYMVFFGIPDLVLAFELAGVLEATALGGLLLPMTIKNTALFVMTLGFGYWLLFRRALEEIDERYLEVSRRFETLMRYAGDGYVLVDRSGRIEGANASFLRLCDREMGQIVGRPFLNMVSKGHRTKVGRAIEKGLKGNTVNKLEYELGPSGSSPHVVASSFTPLRDQNEALQGLLVVVWDMKVHRQLQEEREKRSKVESRDSVRRVLTNLLPVLLMGGDAQAKMMYTKMVMDSFEKAFDMDKAVLQNPDNVPEYLCMTMNGIGGGFKWDERAIGDETRKVRVRFENDRCPWGKDANKNPFMCQLCLGIFSRAFGKLRPAGNVSLIKTIAKGDMTCLVIATVEKREKGTVTGEEE